MLGGAVLSWTCSPDSSMADVYRTLRREGAPMARCLAPPILEDAHAQPSMRDRFDADVQVQTEFTQRYISLSLQATRYAAVAIRYLPPRLEPRRREVT